ncbi:MAG: hypothetical protein ACM31E_02060 [Fibrobacterota bacterium]
MNRSLENNEYLSFHWDHAYSKRLKSAIDMKKGSIPLVARNLQEYFDFLDNVLPKHPLPPRKPCTTTKMFEL